MEAKDKVVKKKLNLSHLIVEKLRLRITRWEYPPNFPLNEEALGNEFNVSRSPVREALKALEASGFIQKMTNRTYVVKQVRQSEVEELYDMRLALELYSIEILAQKPDLHDKVTKLRDVWLAIQLEGEDNQSLADADQAFHEGLVAMVGNSVILHELQKLNERLYVFRMMDFDQPNRVDSTCKQHLAILDAVLSGNQDEARKCLRTNVIDGRNNVNKGFAEILTSSYESAVNSH